MVESELDFDIVSAIKFDISFDTNEVINAIKKYNDWIFTSVNAIRSIQLILAKYHKKFEQKIYCVGDSAFELLTEMGYFTIKKYDSKKELSEAINWKEEKTYTYFTNDHKTFGIPKEFEHEKSTIDTIEVYKTIICRPEINHFDYKHILFFSPLALRSIIGQYPELIKCHLICAGPSTVETAKALGALNLDISKEPKLSSMVEFVLNF